MGEERRENARVRERDREREERRERERERERERARVHTHTCAWMRDTCTCAHFRNRILKQMRTMVQQMVWCTAHAKYSYISENIVHLP